MRGSLHGINERIQCFFPEMPKRFISLEIAVDPYDVTDGLI